MYSVFSRLSFRCRTLETPLLTLLSPQQVQYQHNPIKNNVPSFQAFPSCSPPSLSGSLFQTGTGSAPSVLFARPQKIVPHCNSSCLDVLSCESHENRARCYRPVLSRLLCLFRCMVLNARRWQSKTTANTIGGKLYRLYQWKEVCCTYSVNNGSKNMLRYQHLPSRVIRAKVERRRLEACVFCAFAQH